MKKIGIFLVFLMLVAVSTLAQAEVKAGSFSVTPFIGGYFFEGNHGYKEWPDYDYKDKPIFGLRAGYNFTEHIGAELLFHYLRGEVDAPFDNYFNRYGASLEGLYHFNPKGIFVPFVAAGLGAVHIGNTDKEPGTDEFVVHYGAGLKIFITENVALRADVRHFIPMSNGERFNDLFVTFGITFAFGGEKKEIAKPQVEERVVPAAPVEVVVDSDKDGVPDYLDKCPGTPIGVAVDKDGCPLDSDKDGVPDYLDKCPGTPIGVAVDKDGCPLDSDKDGVPDYLDKCPNTPAGATVDKDGCMHEKVVISLNVEFDTKKAIVNKKYHEEIKKVADFMQAFPETNAVIEGHTDNVGKEAQNIRLSQARADSVRQYLIDKFGIDSSRLTAVGYGPNKPIASNETKEGRQKNRRVEAAIEAVQTK